MSGFLFSQTVQIGRRLLHCRGSQDQPSRLQPAGGPHVPALGPAKPYFCFGCSGWLVCWSPPVPVSGVGSWAPVCFFTVPCMAGGAFFTPCCRSALEASVFSSLLLLQPAAPHMAAATRRERAIRRIEVSCCDPVGTGWGTGQGGLLIHALPERIEASVVLPA